MAKIHEEIIAIKISRLVPDNIETENLGIGTELKDTLGQVIEQVVEPMLPGAVVEIINLG